MTFPAVPMLDIDWPAPEGIGAACSLREGGISTGAYASLNLGDHVGDEVQAVRENRGRFAAAIAARPVYLKQVHGSGAVVLGKETPDGVEADVCATRERGIACTIMVADCMPVLFASDDGQVVGAAHAGWRGLAGAGEAQGFGVIESACKLLAALGAQPASLVAWLGPCIGPAAFEVGAEVKAAFEAVDPAMGPCFVPYRSGPAGEPKWLADLPALARMRLRAAGVTRIAGNDGSDAWCTVKNPSRFFSHRRDRVSGRFAACAWLA